MEKSYTWVRLTASGKVSPNPVKLASVVVMAHDSKHGKVTLYDGESSSDPQIIQIKTASGESKSINFIPPLQTDRGLYVYFTQDADEVLVCYALDEE